MWFPILLPGSVKFRFGLVFICNATILLTITTKAVYKNQVRYEGLNKAIL